MALDEWLLDQHRQGLAPPTLRFYTWSGPTISLGYHQRRIPGHWQSLSWQGQRVDLVRRPTGGRAVLHDGDLTYALVVPDGGGDRLALYEHLCAFLIQGWRSLGVDLTYGQAGRGYRDQANCFDTATGADLVTPSGDKLIGSAQLRRQGAILQQGSMRLNPNLALLRHVFATEPRLPSPLPLAPQPDQAMAQVLEAMTIAAAAHFQVTFTVEPLSATEWAEVLGRQPIP